MSLSASPSFFSSTEDCAGTNHKKVHNSCPDLPKSDDLCMQSVMRHRKSVNHNQNKRQSIDLDKKEISKNSLKSSSTNSSGNTLPEETDNNSKCVRGRKCLKRKKLSSHSIHDNNDNDDANHGDIYLNKGKSDDRRQSCDETSLKAQKIHTLFNNDESSYSLAIRASLNDQACSGFYSSCEEDDTEKCDQTLSEGN